MGEHWGRQTWVRFKDGKGGKPDGEVSHRIAQVTPLGRPEEEGSANERWRLGGKGAVQVKKITQREIEAAYMGENWGGDMR